MKQKPIIEKHYIIIGSNRYQIVFDAKVDDHDILIRGLFHWDDTDSNRITEIEFLIDNLSTVKIPHIISRAVWCSNQNRIELHINTKTGAVLRTLKKMPIPNGFNLENGKTMELVLRIYDETDSVKDCEEFELPKPNEHEIKDISTKRIFEEDKDGSILIGTLIAKP